MPVTHPQPTGLIPKSSCMRGPATDMQTRSRYVIANSRMRNARTRYRCFMLQCARPHAVRTYSLSVSDSTRGLMQVPVKEYTIGRSKLLLPADHALDRYQTKWKRYD